MCGFVVSTDSYIDKVSQWNNSVNCIQHRGPDSRETIHNKKFSATHFRLEIIGLGDHAKQPYSKNMEEDVLLFNGELYNFKSIFASELKCFRSDTSMLYELLQNEQYEKLNSIRGMFSFVYINFLRNEIVSGRDFFGIKPLYFLSYKNKLFFSSTVAPLIKLNFNKTDINFDVIAHYLASGLILEGRNLISGISKHEKGNIKIWDLNTSKLKKEININLTNSHSHNLENALRNSLKLHFVSDVPVGLLLSGGLDSTLLAALCRKENKQVQTFSLINPNDKFIDESTFIDHNLKRLGLPNQKVEYFPKDSLAAIIAIIKSSGEPFTDAAYIPLYFLTKSVSKNLKVVLAGEGADELFLGYSRYKIEMAKNFIKFLLNKQFISLATKLLNHDHKNFEKQLRVLKYLMGPTPSVAHSNLLFAEWENTLEILPEQTLKALRIFEDNWEKEASKNYYQKLNSERNFDTFSWLANVLLEKSDRASMQNGVEIRVPYLDSEVWNVSNKLKIKNSHKDPLRDILYRNFPDVKIPTKKKGLSVNFNEVIYGSGLIEYLKWGLNDKKSFLFFEKNSLTSNFLEAVKKNNYLSFRVATLAVWQNEYKQFL